MGKFYDVVYMDSNKKFSKTNMGIGQDIKDMINTYTDVGYDELEHYGRLHSIIPKYDEYNDIEELYFIFSYDDPVYNIAIKVEDEIINKELTKHCLDIILKSNIITLNDKKYTVENVVTDISYSSPEITIECKLIK